MIPDSPSLINAAKLCLSFYPASFFIFRGGLQGGDEFVVVGMGPIPGEETLEAAVQRFRHRLFEHSVLQLPIQSRVLHYPGVSVGVVAVDPAHTSVDEALRQADASMYEVKRQRRALG